MFVVQFLVVLDTSLLNIALPEISTALGFTPTGLQWVVSGYLLTYAGFMLLGGRLGDVLGRRRVLLIGLSLFVAASVLGGLAWGGGVLVVARAVQGLAGALIAPAALALIATEVPDELRGRATGLWSAAGAAGGAVGVVLSGALTDGFGWRSVLLVNVPIAVVALLSTARGVAAARPSAERVRLDLPGAALVTAGVAALVFAVSSGGDHGWGSGQVLIGFAVALPLLAAFLVVEARSPHPVMPLRLFTRRSVVGANVYGFMLSAGQLAAFYFVSLYVQNVWGLSPTTTGLMFLPFCAFVGVGVTGAVRLLAANGPRSTLLLFSLISTVGMAGFAMMPTETSFWLGILLPSMFCGAGIGGSLVVLGHAATEGVAEDDAGVASGVLNSSRQLGGTIGLAVLVTIAAAASSTAGTGPLALAVGYQHGLTIATVFLIVGGILGWAILPGRTNREPDPAR